MTAIRIFHASDLHFGEEDRDALDWFAALVRDEQPDAVVITGDITMHGSQRQFAAAEQWLSGLPAPLLLGIGNHDLPYYHHMIRRVLRPYARYEALARAVESEWKNDGVALVPLCTIAPAQWRLNWSKGVVSKLALAATIARLSQVQSAAMKLVMAHHPLVETGTRGTALTRGGDNALAALARAGVTAVLSGHVHDPFDLTYQSVAGPVRMIGAGTLSKRLRTTAPSFNELVIAQSLTVNVRDYLPHS
ncbi:MAG: metallophosphoesterase [Sphingopyxis sp.]